MTRSIVRHPLRPLVYYRAGLWLVVRWRSPWAVEVLWADLERDKALAWAREWAAFHLAWTGGVSARSN